MSWGIVSGSRLSELHPIKFFVLFYFGFGFGFFSLVLASMCTRGLFGAGEGNDCAVHFQPFRHLVSHTNRQNPFFLPHFFKNFPHLRFLSIPSFLLLLRASLSSTPFLWMHEEESEMLGALASVEQEGTEPEGSPSALLPSLNLVRSLIGISLRLHSADILYQFFFYFFPFLLNSPLFTLDFPPGCFQYLCCFSSFITYCCIISVSYSFSASLYIALSLCTCQIPHLR